MASLHHNRTPMKTKRQQRRNRIKAMLIGIFLLIVLLLGILISLILRAAKPEAPQENEQPAPTEPPKPTINISLPKEFVDNNTASEYIVLYDVTSDKIVYSKNADARCYPASTTKILTALVTIKHANADTVFTVGEEITLIDPQSSVAYLRQGHRLDLQTMLEAIMLPSGNDAAYTAAANVGRIIANDQSLDTRTAISRFCEEMNAVAKSLGTKNSHFANPDGIHDDNHYTTAADLALIAKAALNEPLLAKVVGEAKVVRSFLSGESGVTWFNTNELLSTESRFLFEDATGMKTGHTDQAGYCLAASAERDGVKLIAILMNASSKDGRFEDAKGLFTVAYDSID